MTGGPTGRHQPSLAFGPLLLLAAAVLVVHLVAAASSQYGWFIDEFYYYACTDRLDWGYVDHPPLSIFVLRLVRDLFGDSRLAARAIPALCGATTVLLGGVMAQRLGARRWGQMLAAIAIASTPLLVAIFGFYSMNAIEVMLLSGCSLLLIDLFQGKDDRRWWLVGLVIGLAFLNKHTSLLFVGALALGVLATPQRRVLKSRGLWIGIGVCLLVALPNLVWQVQHDWVSLDFYRNAGTKNVATSPLEALFTQVLSLNPGSLPIWGAGMWALLRDPRVRPMGLLFAIYFIAIVVWGESRQDRIAGAVPLVMAAGAAYWDRHAGRGGRLGLLVAPLVVALVLSPVFLPLLPPAQLARYAGWLGVVPELEAHERALALPQWFADRVEWDVLVSAVEAVYARLPEHEKENAIVLTRNYGGAGALELLGEGLPPVYALHNSYHDWGPPEPFDVAIVVQISEAELLEAFESVTKAGEFQCEFCRQWRQPTPIHFVRGPKRPIAEAWLDWGYRL